MALRAINSAGSAPSSNIVNGVDLGAADAGYTTLAAAIAAGSDGDTFVITEDMDAALTGTNYTVTLTNIRITCTDAVRSERTGYGSGARIDHAYAMIFTASSGAIVAENVGRTCQYSIGFVANGAHTFRLSRIHGKAVGASEFLRGTGGATVITDNNCIEIFDGKTSFGYARQYISGTVSCFNDIALITNTTATITTVFSGCRIANCAALLVTGANAPSTAYYQSCVAHPSYTAGYNMSTGTDAPGTTVYNSVTAETFTKTTGARAPDFHVDDRATLETYPGADVSTEVYVADLDADLDERGDEWFVGADWVADASSTATPAQQRSGLRLGLRLGL